jgi:urea transport system permease protein
MRNDMFSVLRRSPFSLAKTRDVALRLGAVIACLALLVIAIPNAHRHSATKNCETSPNS